MSKDIIVLTPNGRRLKVHCTPDTSILQVLEDVCQKQGFQPTDYGLKHHNHMLDLSSTIRFSNLPNKATVELVETDNKRTESNVTIGLLLEDGERRTAEFSPNTSLYDLITSLAPNEFHTLLNPTIMYMRQEVTGLAALREKTLRHLGLIGGRAILRLLDKQEEATQANVSTVYRKSAKAEIDLDSDNKKHENIVAKENNEMTQKEIFTKSNDKTLDPVKVIKMEKEMRMTDLKPGTSKGEDKNNEESMYSHTPAHVDNIVKETDKMSSETSEQNNLERRLKIEEEVTFLGTRKAIVFQQPDIVEAELDDLPDDFYELTVEEVRKLYHELQNNRMKLENAPLLTSTKKDELEQSMAQTRLTTYKNVVVRIQFPDRVILQGVFSPTNTIEDINNFVKEHLHNPDQPFHIFTTPIKETIDPKVTLHEAKFVPCVHMHFKWLQEDLGPPYLKEEIYSKQTSSDAASILASKYRAPSRRRDEAGGSSRNTTSSKGSKAPKWFKT